MSEAGWLTVKEAAVVLGLSSKAVYDLVAAEVIPCRRLGLKRGKIVLDRADVTAYWDASKGKAKAGEPKVAFRHVRPPSPSRRPS
jgi:excisionase family DNA binding protein